MKVAIITGITGQDGAYLTKLLLNNNYKVIGLVRGSLNKFTGLNYLGVLDRVEIIRPPGWALAAQLPVDFLPQAASTHVHHNARPRSVRSRWICSHERLPSLRNREWPCAACRLHDRRTDTQLSWANHSHHSRDISSRAKLNSAWWRTQPNRKQSTA